MGTSNLQLLEALDMEYIRSRTKSHVRLALLSGTVSIDARSTEYEVQEGLRINPASWELAGHVYSQNDP